MLQMIGSQLGHTDQLIRRFIDCTFAGCQANAIDNAQPQAIETTEAAAGAVRGMHVQLEQRLVRAARWLMKPQVHGSSRAELELQGKEMLVQRSDNGDSVEWMTTSAGRAVYLSGLSPDEGVRLLSSLRETMAKLRSQDDLHLVLQLTPPNEFDLFQHCGDEKWNVLQAQFASLTEAQHKLLETYGIYGAQIDARSFGHGIPRLGQGERGPSVEGRRYAHCFCGLLLWRLHHHSADLEKVATIFRLKLGSVQAFQASAATFASKVRAFCEEMGWALMASIVLKFQVRAPPWIHRLRIRDSLRH